MNHIQQLAAEASLKKMLSDGHFSICTINKINEISGAIPDKDAHKTLNMLHCVNYMDMPQELLDELPWLIKRALGGPVIDVEEIFKPSTKIVEMRRPTLFSRLLSA